MPTPPHVLEFESFICLCNSSCSIAGCNYGATCFQDKPRCASLESLYEAAALSIRAADPTQPIFFNGAGQSGSRYSNCSVNAGIQGYPGR